LRTRGPSGVTITRGKGPIVGDVENEVIIINVSSAIGQKYVTVQVHQSGGEGWVGREQETNRKLSILRIRAHRRGLVARRQEI